MTLRLRHYRGRVRATPPRLIDLQAALSKRDQRVEDIAGQIERTGPVSFLCVVMHAYEAMAQEAKANQGMYRWPPEMYAQAAKGVRKAWNAMFYILPTTHHSHEDVE